MAVYVGTSGWHYSHWRGGLYPEGLPASQWLRHYADRFATVELNNAFYRLPETTAFASWAAQVPDDFVVAIKASRYLTHVRRLKDPAEPVTKMVNHASALGARLGPFLLQLPPTLQADPGALETVLGAFPAGVRVAVEPRHRSWFCEEVHAVLSERAAALCIADGGALDSPWWRTTGWGYLRMHAGHASPPPAYGRRALESLARRIASLWGPTDDVFAYFNNDSRGCAPRDARRFAAALERAGLQPTRVPAARETPLTRS